MSDPKREYERGYHDALEEKSYSDGFDGFTTLITCGFFGGPRENAGDYREGFHDGREDRKR